MCKCADNNKLNSKMMNVKHSWRLNTLWHIEKLIRDVGQEKRAKRMGMCGNTIFVKAKKGDLSSVLFEPQLRCKDRVCPICNSYRASILAKKVEELGKKMSNPHFLTVTANSLNRSNLETALACYKNSMRQFKRERTWFKKFIKGGVEHIEITYNEKKGWHIHSHILVDLNVNRKVENMILTDKGYFIDPIKKDLQHVLLKVGLGVISDIRPVTEGYGKEISKYSMKFTRDMDDKRIKEVIVKLKGKRLVSKFGNCYGLKAEESLEELTAKEESEYEHFGTIEEVVDKAFRVDGVDSELVEYVKEAVKRGLVTIHSNGNKLIENDVGEESRELESCSVC